MFNPASIHNTLPQFVRTKACRTNVSCRMLPILLNCRTPHNALTYIRVSVRLLCSAVIRICSSTPLHKLTCRLGVGTGINCVPAPAGTQGFMINQREESGLRTALAEAHFTSLTKVNQQPLPSFRGLGPEFRPFKAVRRLFVTVQSVRTVVEVAASFHSPHLPNKPKPHQASLGPKVPVYSKAPPQARPRMQAEWVVAPSRSSTARASPGAGKLRATKQHMSLALFRYRHLELGE